MSLSNFSRYVSKTWPHLSVDEHKAKVMELYTKPVFIAGVYEGGDVISTDQHLKDLNRR